MARNIFKVQDFFPREFSSHAPFMKKKSQRKKSHIAFSKAPKFGDFQFKVNGEKLNWSKHPVRTNQFPSLKMEFASVSQKFTKTPTK